MFNVTVLKLRDIVKYFVGIIILLIIIFLTKYFLYNRKKFVNNKINIEFSKYIEEEIPYIKTSSDIENLSNKENQINIYLKKTLKAELSSLELIENDGENLKTNKQIGNLQNTENGKIEENQTADSNQNNIIQNVENVNLVDSSQNADTQITTQNPIAENFNAKYKKVKIRNQTSYQLTEEILNPNINIDNKNILIFHTHSCESYTPSEKYQYTQTGNFRTTDLNYSVVRVGTELENYLKAYKINVIHNTSYHDYPSYNGSYTRSLETVQNCIKKTPTDIIIDLHRDAVGSKPDYAPTVKIGDDNCARIMFVIGTNDGGMWHPNWNQNLKFAIKLQEKAEEMYPGLFMPILLTKSRYNQHTGKFANIMEVGATGNTLDQCLNSMKYLSNVFNEILNK